MGEQRATYVLVVVIVLVGLLVFLLGMVRAADLAERPRPCVSVADDGRGLPECGRSA